MKFICITLIFLCFLFSVTSCKKSTTETVTTDEQPVMEATINGVQWKASQISVKSTAYGPVITGSTNDGKSIVMMADTSLRPAYNFKPMPAVLQTFTCYQDSFSNNRRLTWITRNEQNLSHFILERSNDAIIFTPLQSVPATGLPGGSTNYRTMDKPPVTDPFVLFIYYRLKMINNDSSYTYSSIGLTKPFSPILYKYATGEQDYAVARHGTLSAIEKDAVKRRMSGTFAFTYLNETTGLMENVENGVFKMLTY